jgi:SpoVK/Ycf46/Vps4 family AAA+-type ATPase
LDLLRHEFIDELPARPIWGSQLAAPLEQLVAERGAWDRLADAGLSPTRTALLIGPPGVGKTLAARFVAHELALPLLVLDLAAVMSSLLGRTGTNIRQVMDYAKSRPCVLLIDELDAVAKRRDDIGDVGELKRLVTVLLQAVDDWPASGLLLAATNHPDLLDPAAWRRFEMVIEFPLPNSEQVSQAVDQFLIPDQDLSRPLLSAVKTLLRGKSYSEIERDMIATRRRAALGDGDVATELAKFVSTNAAALPVGERAALAAEAITRGEMSQHKAHEFFSVSRDVIRRASAAQDKVTTKQGGSRG